MNKVITLNLSHLENYKKVPVVKLFKCLDFLWCVHHPIEWDGDMLSIDMKKYTVSEFSTGVNIGAGEFNTKDEVEKKTRDLLLKEPKYRKETIERIEMLIGRYKRLNCLGIPFYLKKERFFKTLKKKK